VPDFVGGALSKVPRAFVEDDALLFPGFDECVEKISRYFPDEPPSERIAAVDRARRTDRSGHDAQAGVIVERLLAILIAEVTTDGARRVVTGYSRGDLGG